MFSSRLSSQFSKLVQYFSSDPRNFSKFWLATTVSQFGAQVTLLALPLIAALDLSATPLQVGMLLSAQTLPVALFSLPAGILADRTSRSRILMASNGVRGVLLLAVSGLAGMGLLTMPLLYVIGFLIGTLTVFYDVTYWAHLPELLPTSRLMAGNSKLSLSASASESFGPALAGALVQLLSAKIALCVDALSFFISSALMGASVGGPHEAIERPIRKSIRHELAQGFRVLLTDQILRSLALRAALWKLIFSAIGAVMVLYLSQHLRMTPSVIGMAFSCTGIGYFVGTMANGFFARRLGMGPAILWSIAACASMGVLIPLVPSWHLPLPVVLSLLFCLMTVVGVTGAIYNINQLSIRQAMTPRSLAGRVNATFQLLTRGAMPLGALTGGWMGSAIGLGATILFASLAGLLFATIGLLYSPVRNLMVLPDQFYV
ncbi:MFS transporter [Rhizobacter sp. P5_C2]